MKTISIGSGRSEKVYQRNPETQRYDIPVGWWAFGWWGWVWWGAGGILKNIPLWDLNSDILSNLYSVATAVAKSR